MSATPFFLARWRDEIRYRPLTWMCLAAVLGVALGGAWVMLLSAGVPAALARTDVRLLGPLFLSALLAVIGLRLLLPTNYRGVVTLMLVGFFASYASWRLVPPIGDISALTTSQPDRAKPLTAPKIWVRGVVADYPRRNEFNVQFPLECSAPQRGRLWVRAAYNCPVRVGEEVSFLSEIRPLSYTTNPAQRQRFWYFVVSGCWAQATKLKKLKIERAAPEGSLVKRIESLRSAILARYTTLFQNGGLARYPFPSSTAQLMTAMVFGEGGLSTPLPRQLRDDFRAAGMSHLLVASGAQCAFIGWIVFGSRKTLRVRGVWLLLLLIPLLMLYAMIVGGSPSIWRATLLGLLAALALCVGRRTDAITLWCAALLVLLIFDPASAWSLSLQLTFGATWGLICLAPALERVLIRLGQGPLYRKTAQAFAFTLGAQLGTLPLSLFHFGSLSTVGLFANFLALPLAAALLFCGSLGLLFAFVTPINYFLTRKMELLAHFAGSQPGANWQNVSLSLSATVSSYVLLASAAAAMALWPFDDEQRRDWAQWWQGKVASARVFIAAVPPLSSKVICVLVFIFLVWRFWPRPEVVRLVMLDVGQGESLVVITPKGKAILIDGGSSDERTEVGQGIIVPALQALGINHLEAVVLTHADADHCNALPTVFREISVGAFVDGVQASNQQHTAGASEYQAVKREAERQNVPVVVPHAGEKWNYDGVTLNVLGPTQPFFNSENDNALSIRLEYGATSVLFTGDLEGAGEERLVQSGLAVPSTLLKVSHHGSGGSSTTEFLKAVRPQAALISCGRFNHYGHPAVPALERLQKAGATIFRTDIDGAIEATCDRSQCRVEALN